MHSKKQSPEITFRYSKVLGIAAATVATLAGIGYWYVFIAGSPQLDPPQVQQNTGLKFQLETFNSKAMGQVRSYGLILPPGYEQNPQKRYPVIFLLHGGHDDVSAYANKYAVLNVLHDLYKSGIPPSIVITPDGNDLRGSNPFWDPDYYDGANGNLGTAIGSELVQVVKSRYRTLEAPQFWAMGGISSGGWGAFNIGLRHLDNFNILFSHSGYFTDRSGAQNSPQQVVQQRLNEKQRQRLRVYLDAGENDTDFLASTQLFHQTLNKLGIANVFYAFPGGHGLSGANVGWNYFHKHLKDSLTYVGQQFKAAGS